MRLNLLRKSRAVVFTKGGLILGMGGGEGVLTFRGRHYPFTVSGISVGATIGAPTTKLVGQAFNLRAPNPLTAPTVRSAPVALAGGAGSARVRNTNGAITNGVILQLSGPKVGVELSVLRGPRELESLVSLGNEFHPAQSGLIIVVTLLGTLRQPDFVPAPALMWDHLQEMRDAI